MHIFLDSRKKSRVEKKPSPWETDPLQADCLIPGVRGAEGPLIPVVSTMLPSVCTTIRVAFSGFKLSPIWRAVLPDYRRNKEFKLIKILQCNFISVAHKYPKTPISLAFIRLSSEFPDKQIQRFHVPGHHFCYRMNTWGSKSKKDGNKTPVCPPANEFVA